MKDIRDHSLLAHNTFGIDARCRRYLEYASVDEAQTICRQLSDTDYPLLIIGEGSNLLLTADYPATVITPEARFDVQVVAEDPDGETVDIECWAGTTFDDVVAYARTIAKPGDCVLFSPACASFDQFPNFMERGRYFKEKVKQL